MRNYYKILGGILAIVVIGLWSIIFSRPRSPIPEGVPPGSPVGKMKGEGVPVSLPKQLGSPTGKVVVKAVIPAAGCQVPAVNALKDIVKEYPKQVFVKFIDFGSPEAEKEGCGGCAAILVNGKSTFTIKEKGKEKKISLGHSPGMGYTVEDLKTIIKEEIKKVYK